MVALQGLVGADYLPKGSTRMPTKLNLPILALVVCMGTACSSDPVAYSAPVGINLKAKGGDVKGGVVVDDKGITTESGNPYGAFVTEARKSLGKDPSRIEVTSAQMLLGGASKGVSALEQVFTDRVDLLFVMNDTNNSFPVAHAIAPKGGGPVNFSVDFDAKTVQAADFSKLSGGGFKVVVRGAAAPTFAGKDMEADLQVVLRFEAFE